MALAQLLGGATGSGRRIERTAETQSAGAETAALHGAKAKRVIYPVHGRSAEPSGTVRLQTAAGEVRRHAAAAGIAQRLPRRVHQPELEAAGAEVQVRPTRTMRRRDCRNCCRTWPRSSTMSPIVKSLVTDAFNHAPAQILMNTGSQQFGRPSMGAWTTYGLGSESRDLPGFVVSTRETRAPAAATRTGAAASCPRCIKACRSAPAAIRCCISRIRGASIRSCSATRSIQ